MDFRAIVLSGSADEYREQSGTGHRIPVRRLDSDTGNSVRCFLSKQIAFEESCVPLFVLWVVGHSLSSGPGLSGPAAHGRDDLARAVSATSTHQPPCSRVGNAWRYSTL